MRGVAFAGDRSIEFISVPDPAPGPGEVVLAIKASGMCGSDLKFYRAPKSGGLAALGFKDNVEPVIAGHEPCGEIVALGRDLASSWRVGDRVMVHHYRGCDCCHHCRTGWNPQAAFRVRLLDVLDGRAS